MIASLRSDNPDWRKSVGMSLFIVLDQHVLAGTDQAIQPVISPFLRR